MSRTARAHSWAEATSKTERRDSSPACLVALEAGGSDPLRCSATRTVVSVGAGRGTESELVEIAGEFAISTSSSLQEPASGSLLAATQAAVRMGLQVVDAGGTTMFCTPSRIGVDSLEAVHSVGLHADTLGQVEGIPYYALPSTRTAILPLRLGHLPGRRVSKGR